MTGKRGKGLEKPQKPDINGISWYKVPVFTKEQAQGRSVERPVSVHSNDTDDAQSEKKKDDKFCGTINIVTSEAELLDRQFARLLPLFKTQLTEAYRNPMGVNHKREQANKQRIARLEDRISILENLLLRDSREKVCVQTEGSYRDTLLRPKTVPVNKLRPS